MNDEKLETILERQREEYQRYLGVLAESFENQVTMIAESTGEINEQIPLIKDLIVKNTEDIEMMKIDLHFIGNDIKKKTNREETMLLEKRVTVLEKSGK